jgi:hypothetical protein
MLSAPTSSATLRRRIRHLAVAIAAVALGYLAIGRRASPSATSVTTARLQEVTP